VWDAASEKLVHNLSSENGEADRIFLSPDNRFAVGLFEHYYTVDTALVWDLDSGKRLCRIRGGTVWNYASFSADGLVFCLCGYKKEQQEYRQVVQARVTQTGRLLWTTQLKEGARPSVVITPDGSKAVLLYCRERRRRCGKDGPGWRRYRSEYAPCVRVFDARTGREMIQYRQDLPAAAKYPSVLSGGAAPFFLSVENGETRLRNALDATVEKRLSFHPGYAENAQLSPDGKYIYLDGANPSLWDTTADQEVNSLTTGAMADPAGSVPRWHVTHTTEHVHLKDLSQQTTRTYCLGHYSQYVRILPFPDGERVLMVGDGQYALWNPDKDTAEWTMWFAKELYGAEIRISPDGNIIALGLRDKSGIMLLTTQTGRLLSRIDTPEPVSSIAFSPDGTRLMSALGASGIRVWDTVSGGELASIPAIDGTSVSEAVYSPHGKHILAYYKCEDSNPEDIVRIINAANGATLAELPAETNYSVNTPLSPDGSRLLIESGSAVFMWDMSDL
jgi:WD40 repeat protein